MAELNWIESSSIWCHRLDFSVSVFIKYRQQMSERRDRDLKPQLWKPVQSENVNI